MGAVKRTRWLPLLVGLGLAAGCAAKSAAPPPEAPSPAMERAEPEGGEKRGLVEPSDGDADASSEIDELEAALQEQESSLQSLGIVVDPKLDAAPATDDGAADRCQRICGLSRSICELRDRICALAEDHTDDPRYASTCNRAERDCERASTACSDCT